MAETIASLKGKNAELTDLLTKAQAIIRQQAAENEVLTAAPNAAGTFVKMVDDEVALIRDSNGKQWRVRTIKDNLVPGQTVFLNEYKVVTQTGPFTDTGETGSVTEIYDDGRVLLDRDPEQVVVRLAESLLDAEIKLGDVLLTDGHFAYERVAVEVLTEFLLEEVPDIRYEQIGGLAHELEAVRDALELPYLHPELFEKMSLRPPHGVLLYGPPGCGKTMIAKAVANALAKQSMGEGGKALFISIKGPELLNKYVGETERMIRAVFAEARNGASDGRPVIIFFDEMESMFRTRGSGISSDTESTIVPQLLAEIDGMEDLRNVIVIGASNRQDLIDPALLRPGRLDVKLRVSRPDENGAREILAKYLTADLPLDAPLKTLTDAVITRIYQKDKDTEFLRVTYENGDTEVMYFGDFVSGAMIESVVSRAKQIAIKGHVSAGLALQLTEQALMDAVGFEFAENEDLPNTTNPDDWAKISGKKGQRIVRVHSLRNDTDLKATESAPTTGQYL